IVRRQRERQRRGLGSGASKYHCLSLVHPPIVRAEKLTARSKSPRVKNRSSGASPKTAFAARRLTASTRPAASESAGDLSDNRMLRPDVPVEERRAVSDRQVPPVPVGIAPPRESPCDISLFAHSGDASSRAPNPGCSNNFHAQRAVSPLRPPSPARVPPHSEG